MSKRRERPLTDAQKRIWRYDRPQIRRLILFGGGAALLLSIAVGIGVTIWIRAYGGDYEEVLYWYRAVAMIVSGLLFLLPFFIWAVSGVNVLRAPVITVLYPLLGFPLGFAIAGKRAEPAFYEVSAQIIPVLLLVLAVEFRAFVVRQRSESIPDGEELFKFSAALVVVALIGGEGIALGAIAQKPPEVPIFAPGPVAGAITTGFLAVLMYSILGPPRSPIEDS